MFFTLPKTPLCLCVSPPFISLRLSHHPHRLHSRTLQPSSSFPRPPFVSMHRLNLFPSVSLVPLTDLSILESPTLSSHLPKAPPMQLLVRCASPPFLSLCLSCRPLRPRTSPDPTQTGKRPHPISTIFSPLDSPIFLNDFTLPKLHPNPHLPLSSPFNLHSTCLVCWMKPGWRIWMGSPHPA